MTREYRVNRFGEIEAREIRNGGGRGRRAAQGQGAQPPVLVPLQETTPGRWERFFWKRDLVGWLVFAGASLLVGLVAVPLLKLQGFGILLAFLFGNCVGETSERRRVRAGRFAWSDAEFWWLGVIFGPLFYAMVFSLFFLAAKLVAGFFHP